MKEILKKILYLIWTIITYLFILIWKILSSIFGQIRDYNRLANNSRRTKSGSWDQRFKATRELEKHPVGIIGGFILMILIIFGIENSNNPADTQIVKKKNTKNMVKSHTIVPQNDNKDNNIDTTILLGTIEMDDESDFVESYNITDTISFDSIKKKDDDFKDFDLMDE